MTLDRLGRPLRDLRISVTDRCNFRCTYCMPKEVFGSQYAFMPRDALLTFEEVTRLSRLFVEQGVEKIRLTGGEPLLRRDLARLVAMLAAIPGLRDLTLTTNGSLLTDDVARSLKAAGLQRITISLDALDDGIFRAMNDVQFPVARVLEAIEVAQRAGLSPVKVDMVVKRGVNDSQIVPMAEYFRRSGQTVRFIEYMDVGNSNGWRMDDVVSGAEIHGRISERWPLRRADPEYFGEVAERWLYEDGQGEIGIITSVTQPFCGSCTRARLSADGELYTCLFASHGLGFRELLRSGAGDAEIERAVAAAWSVREDRYSELRSAATTADAKVEMSRIGG